MLEKMRNEKAVNEDIFLDNQARLWKGRKTIDNICILNYIVDKEMAVGEKNHIFAYLKNIFDVNNSR